MYYAVLEWSISCPKCDAAIMLNGPLQKAHCNRCQSDINIPDEYWKDMLGDIYQEVKKELKEGEGSNSSVFGTFKTTMMYARLHPYCLECKTNMEIDGEITEPIKYKCKKCGSNIPISPPPEWFKEILPSTKLLVYAELATGTEGEEPAVSGPIVFSCPKCGGALEVDGTERLVPCEYCDSKVYLPDDLWFRLHPAKKKERWFVGLE